MAKPAYIAGISLVIGAGMGWALHGAQPSSETAAGVKTASTQAFHAEAPRGAANMVELGQLRALLRGELAGVVKSELAMALAIHDGVSPSAVSVPTPAAPPSPELIAQQNQALQTIDMLVSGSQWGEQERMNLHQQLAVLDPEQAEQAMQKVVRAIDSGSMQITTEGSVL